MIFSKKKNVISTSFFDRNICRSNLCSSLLDLNRQKSYSFESLLQKKIEIIYPILSLFHSKFSSIFSNNYFSVHSNPLSIIFNLLLSLFRYKFTSIFSNTYFSIPYNPSSILLNLFPSLNLFQSPLFYLILFYIYQVYLQSFILYLILSFIYPRESF